MNAMGHNVPGMIGVDQRSVAPQITRLLSDSMVTGERGVHDMTEMEMSLPENTAAMMTGAGLFDAVGMGDMFSVVKVRKARKRGDYSDPGWFTHPAATVACEWTAAPAELRHDEKAQGSGSKKPMARPSNDVEVTVCKPTGGHSGH